MMFIQLITSWTLLRAQDMRREAQEHPERGELLQTVIIVGLLAAASIVIVGILVAKAIGAANGVQTQ
jgi:hypothetical protein